MNPINRDTRTSIHFNIAYLLARHWTPDKGACLDYQKSLLAGEMDFERSIFSANRFTLIRGEPSNLQIILEAPNPQVCSVAITAANPQYDLALFQKEAAAVMQAYQATWQDRQYQVLQCTARIHHLYSCSDHAFRYLWEERLGQKPDDLQMLGGRPVAGGGLRLVMPPWAPPGEEPSSIELRIESYLRESDRLFIETAFVWPQPRIIASDGSFDPAQRMQIVEAYATGQVWQFLAGK